jgi:hypothetical protein
VTRVDLHECLYERGWVVDFDFVDAVYGRPSRLVVVLLSRLSSFVVKMKMKNEKRRAYISSFNKTLFLLSFKIFF